MNVAEIAQLPDAAAVFNFQARVISTYPVKTGQGHYGAWACIDLIVEDEHEQKIKVSWFDDKEISVFPSSPNELHGEVIVINARKNAKNQIVGAKKGSYEGKPQLSVNGRHLVRSGRPSQPVGHNDPEWMSASPTQAPGAFPGTPTAGNATPPVAQQRTAVPPATGGGFPAKEKLTIPSVLALANFLAEELSTTYRQLAATRNGVDLSDSVEAIIIDKTGVSVNMILMSVFKGELHCSNQIIEDLCGSASKDPFGPPMPDDLKYGG